MVKFLKPNKAVIVLQGRFAGRKAVIVRSFDDGTRDRAYGHCLVAGIAKYPKKVIRKDSAKKTAKKSRVKAFIKLVNYNHIMPTRYTLDVDLKDVVTVDALQSRDKKVAAAKETKARLEERFKTGKNRWFFTKLRYQSMGKCVTPSCQHDSTMSVLVRVATVLIEQKLMVQPIRPVQSEIGFISDVEERLGCG
ncbi:60S ribosomal protein L27-3 [Cinnamomum micranthum f. kanehirae]|uniref:60S ribosomal protein L27-3 n=1 Tax=Cinnamomum micranthum f. kanehirae TaxID=337451 RepID=A0A443P4M0_9MAGN|nr:60S ribosomal protein L27-3 [Cinnamomum micranthum f. kanehirae]